MTEARTPSRRIIAEVSSWPGVETHPGDRGELSIRLGRREIGHLHGDHALHTGFPKAVWKELYEEGRIDYHPVFPGKPGYAARTIEDEDDVRDVIALLRLNYERCRPQRVGDAGGVSQGSSADSGTLASRAQAGRSLS